jgi:hypothetical protein
MIRSLERVPRYSPPVVPAGKLNTTDPDALRMKFGRACPDSAS